MVSPRIPLLLVLARNVLEENKDNRRHTYQSWHETLEEPLVQVAGHHGITFSNFLYNISPFWLPMIVRKENDLDKHQTKLYLEDIERATVSEILTYLTAAGLNTIYQGPAHPIQKMVMNISSTLYSPNTR